MNFKDIKTAIILAVAITLLGYYVDSDPPYASALDTAVEFTTITGILSAVFLFLIVIFRLVINWIYEMFFSA